MKTKKNNKFFIGTVISLFVLVFCVGGAVADIDTALEGAKKMGEKAEQIEQMKKAFSTPDETTTEESANVTAGEQPANETTTEESANVTAEEVIKEKATEALQENIMKKVIGD